MSKYNDILTELLEPLGWDQDGMGLDSNLIAPDGCVIEMDGECPHEHVSPLRAMGMI